MTFIWEQYAAAIPEMFLATMVLISLLTGVLGSEKAALRNTAALARVAVVGTLLLVVMSWPTQFVWGAFPRLAAGEMGSAMFVLDSFAGLVKTMLLLAALVTLVTSHGFFKRTGLARPEVFTLMLISLLGMLLMVSAFDLLMVYIGMEMMSFALYILVTLDRDNPKSAEAGLKYFVLGSLASGIMLYGISLLYGVAGDTSFVGLAQAFATMGGGQGHLVFVLGLVLLLTGFAFKISAVPFHMWTPDVYEGAPTAVTGFMAVLPKIAAFALLMRLLAGPFAPVAQSWQQVVVALAVLTMLVGALLAIRQENLKRLFAYSSIGHVGFMLVGLAAGTGQGITAVLVYLLLYGLMTLGAFAMLTALHNRGVYVEHLSDLAGLGKTAPAYALAFAVFCFSLAGVPPLAGFLAKFYVFKAAVDAGLLWLALVAALLSVVAAYYALRIVKTMYFDEPTQRLETPTRFAPRFMVATLAVLTVVAGVLMDSIHLLAQLATASLF